MFTISCDSLSCLGSSLERLRRSLLGHLTCSHLVAQLGAGLSRMASLTYLIIDSMSAGILDHMSLSKTRLTQICSHDDGKFQEQWGNKCQSKVRCSSLQLCHICLCLLTKVSHMAKSKSKEQRNRVYVLKRAAVKSHCKRVCKQRWEEFVTFVAVNHS